MVMDWNTEIAIAWQVQQANQQFDRVGLWNYRLPHVAATHEKVAYAEMVLGFELDPRFRLFLSYADGWPDFYQSVDLFGTSDLVGGRLMEKASEMLRVIDDAVWQHAKVELDNVLPIAVSKADRDVFVIVTPHQSNAGQVLWFSGTMVEAFPDFDEFFLSMVDYNRETLADFKKAHDRGSQ
jgi:hypothetical protein